MARRLRCGISLQIGAALGTVAAIGVFWLLALEVYDPLKTKSDEIVTNTTAQTAIDWNGIAMDNFLILGLAIVVLGTVAASVFQRQGGF